MRKINEGGYNEAAFGLGLSHGLTSGARNWIDLDQTTTNKLLDRAEKLSSKDGGHNKFLEQIIVWFDVTAPRYWWIQAEMYRISSMSSESTMHSIMKGTITQEDFEKPIEKNYLTLLNFYYGSRQFEELKNALPEGYLQRRIWMMSAFN